MAEEKKSKINELVPEKARIQVDQAQELFESIKGIKINSEDQYLHAVELLKDIKKVIKQLESDRKEAIEPYDPKVRIINEYYRIPRTNLQNLEQVFKKGAVKWEKEQEAKRIEKQRKLEAEAEEKRRKAEQRAEAERLKAEQYRQQGREDMAQKAEARAETASKVSEIPTPIVENTTKVVGISYRTTYKVTIADKKEAVKNMAQDSFLIQFLDINVADLKKMVASMKGKVDLPKGLIVQKDKSASVGAS